MNVALTEVTSFNQSGAPAANIAGEKSAPVFFVADADKLAFEIGAWLSGLNSFLNFRNHLFTEESRYKSFSRDWARELRLAHSTLLRCSRLNFQLTDALDRQNSLSSEINLDEARGLSQALKDAVLLGEGLLRAAPLGFGEWTAWSNFLSGKFKTVKAFEKFISIAEKRGEDYLPESLKNSLESKHLPFDRKSDLRLVLQRLAKILKWLGVIQEMLKNDEPLKVSLLIFARVHEQIQEMISFADKQILRFPNEDNEFFALLDGAAYTASIELRKVYQHELTGLAEIRATPSVYAKIETAYSLLNDSFQQTLINFARLIEPDIEPGQVFPNFQIKLNESLMLRQNLAQTLQAIRHAEQSPETFPLDSLRKQLTEFLNTTLYFLFYKDTETVERFIEEVLVTTNKKDLVPILHRFGAYLETLLGQVNMRALLAEKQMRGEI